MKKKILLYADLNISIVDGSSVWLASIAKLLALDKNNVVDILLKKPITNTVLADELFYFDNISFLTGGEFIAKNNFIDESNVVKVMNKIDKIRDYSCIIVRGFEVVNAIVKDSHLAGKLIPYLTNFCHDKEKISKEEIANLNYIYNNTKQFFVQTVQMKEYLKDVLGVDGSRFKLLNPMIFKDDSMKSAKKPKSIVYAGKIAKGWNILELIEIMDRIYEVDKDITLHFIGDKFNRDLADRKNEILNKLKTMPNVVFYGSLPKSQTTEIISSCELGYSFRSSEIDNDHSLELSSKVLEYCFCEVPLILRNTKMHADVLGEDYPLYTESVKECAEKILDYFSNREKYNKLRETLAQKVERFSPENVYKSVSQALEEFPWKKMRLLITGHDLKFIKQLFPYFEKEFELTVQEYPEYTTLDVVGSKKLLQKNDIIWCEWMLLSAEWYSKHIYSYQRLFIRAHRFELGKKYGFNVKWQNVDTLITVSYYYMEKFIEKFNIPRHKTTVINNFIDLQNYHTEKEDGYKYNISMIGILPMRKGFAKAVDLLKKLKTHDDRYKLYIAGKRPEEFPGSWNVKEQRKYYLDTYEKIEEANLKDSVIFTGWIKTSDFLKKMGYTLSLSDKEFPESFHIAPFECMASGGVGLSLDWEGIEYIYPECAIYNNIDEIAQKIIECNENEEEYRRISQTSKKFIAENYDLPIIWNLIYNTVN